MDPLKGTLVDPFTGTHLDPYKKGTALGRKHVPKFSFRV